MDAEIISASYSSPCSSILVRDCEVTEVLRLVPERSAKPPNASSPGMPRHLMDSQLCSKCRVSYRGSGGGALGFPPSRILKVIMQ